MKKLLVLMLVIGLASMASAAYTLSGPTVVATGGTITISIMQDSTVQNPPDVLILLETTEPGSLGNAIALPAAGELRSIVPFSYAGPNAYNGVAGSLTGQLTTGAHFTVDFTAPGTTGTAVIDLYSPSSDWLLGNPVTDTLTITIVPEPMTVVLLGLGGLLLRRKK